MINKSYLKWICNQARKLVFPIILIAIMTLFTTGCCSNENARYTIHHNSVINPADDERIAQFDALIPTDQNLTLLANKDK